MRHFELSDIPVRSALLRDGRVLANINDDALNQADDQLAEGQRRTVEEQHHTKLIYTVCMPDGSTIGFCWLTSIDWRSRSCELSFALLPEYRIGLGSALVPEAREFMFRELNMRTMINQVLDHNTMLLSTGDQRELSQVTCDYDSYTVGEFRRARYWSRTVEQCVAEAEEFRRRRAERRERILAAAAGKPS